MNNQLFFFFSAHISSSTSLPSSTQAPGLFLVRILSQNLSQISSKTPSSSHTHCSHFQSSSGNRCQSCSGGSRFWQKNLSNSLSHMKSSQLCTIVFEYRHFQNFLLGFSSLFDNHNFITALHPQTRSGGFPPFELPTHEISLPPI